MLGETRGQQVSLKCTTPPLQWFYLRARRASKCQLASEQQPQASNCVSQRDRANRFSVSMSENSWTKSEPRLSIHDIVPAFGLSRSDTPAVLGVVSADEQPVVEP
jgi:hypothetical protein